MKISVVGHADISGEDNDAQYSYGKARSKRFMIVEHGDLKLQWNFPPRTWNTDPDTNAEAFDQINLYFAQLPEHVQQSIFNEYANIHEVLRSTNMQQDDCEGLIEAIRPMAGRLFSQINPDNFYNWVWVFLKPRIPSEMAIVFNADTMPGTRERTYLLEDYKGLIPLAIVVRAACPFWFDFAALTKGQLSREHKDMLAYSLIEQAWPAQCKAMKRLEEFVDHTVGADRNNPAATLMGIGSDDFVYWALSSLVINRLPIVDVMGTSNLTPVVSALYNYVRHRVTTIASSQPAIRNKFAETTYTTDENNQSFLEGFRNRIALTVGQEALGDYYLERQLELIYSFDSYGTPDYARFSQLEEEYSLLNRVAPGIDLGLVMDSLESVKVLQNVTLSEEQITIAAWLFHPYSQVRTVGNFLKERVIALLGLAQAVLLHHGKNDLAKLVSAVYESVDNGSGTHFFGEAIAPLRAAERENYRAVFPMEQRNKKKPKNFVIDDVYALVNSLQDYDINCTFSEATLKKVQGNNPNRTYLLRKDAVVMFMDYAKWLAERPMVRIDPDQIYQRLTGIKAGIEPAAEIGTAGNY